MWALIAEMKYLGLNLYQDIFDVDIQGWIPSCKGLTLYTQYTLITFKQL